MSIVAHSQRRDIKPALNVVRNLDQRLITGQYRLFPDGKRVFKEPDWAAYQPCLPLGYSRDGSEVRECGRCGRKMRKALLYYPLSIHTDDDDDEQLELHVYHEIFCTACDPTQ